MLANSTTPHSTSKWWNARTRTAGPTGASEITTSRSCTARSASSRSRLVLVADHAHRLGQAQRRLENALRHQLRHDVRDADREPQRSPDRPTAQRVLQLAPEPEDLVGIAKHHATDFGQRQPAPAALEQLLAERVLEAAHLAAHGRLRESQLRARGAQRALARDEPEVEQVVVVEPFHRVFHHTSKKPK